MNQFKDIFVGLKKVKNKRVTNLQKCIRVSGKHNDLEEVGVDTYHHTFFEMMGNWSFEDYGKKEAILWAWELLTKVWQLSPSKLYVTVYKTDHEAKNLWEKLTNIDKNRILKFDEKDNFWEMGETGPCGPCSEIHYDKGVGHCDCKDNSTCGVNQCERYVEIWNLVFMQYNRLPSGDLVSLKNISIDTGMGFERIVAILQNKSSNYDTDLFLPLIKKIENISKKKYSQSKIISISMRVIVDHIRTLVFSIGDGVSPSNEGRGYVLRRILRRAIIYGRNLHFNAPFLYKIGHCLIGQMKNYYPEIQEQKDIILSKIEEEEALFYRTLDKGIKTLKSMIKETKLKNQTQLSGNNAFLLYDSYGFPLDLTSLITKENKLSLDKFRFDELMKIQKQKSKGNKNQDHSKFHLIHILSKLNHPTLYLGEKLTQCVAKLIAIITIENFPRSIKSTHQLNNLEDSFYLIYDQSVFYSESGGQVGDQGLIKDQQEHTLFQVLDTIKQESYVLHRVKLINKNGLNITINQKHQLAYNIELRQNIRRNHSATHLLNQALREQLGKHIKQSGSLVNAEKLRFDFTHNKSLSKSEIDLIERKINQNIMLDHSVGNEELPIEKAKQKGALSFFGDRYGDIVRIINMGKSIEFCGGSHVKHTSQIGSFRVINEMSVASGIRRIEAVTGEEAYKYSLKDKENIEAINQLLQIDTIINAKKKITSLIEENKIYKKQIENIEIKNLKQITEKKETIKINSVYLLLHFISNDLASLNNIRSLIDELKNERKSTVILFILTQTNINKIVFFCGVTPDIVGKNKKIHAGEIVKYAASFCHGKGGGRPDFAQAGGFLIDNLDELQKNIIDYFKN